jgi:light-regulated signal transduction histidine kinase (bacteriophytochrome)
MNELTSTRGEILRKSSHDLRGSVGIVSSAATLLSSEGLSQEERCIYLEMLNRNVGKVQALLKDFLIYPVWSPGRKHLTLSGLMLVSFC